MTDTQVQAKVWDKDAVQALIATNDKALSRALWNIFQRQTAAEQSCLQTIEHNKRGFNGTDAEFLSDVAKRLPRYNFGMTPRQIRAVRPRMKKYWRQLLEEIEAKGGRVCYKVAKSTKPEIAKPPRSESTTVLERLASERPANWGSF